MNPKSNRKYNPTNTTELVKALKELAKCKCNGKETCPICLGKGYISYDELMKKIFE